MAAAPIMLAFVRWDNVLNCRQPLMKRGPGADALCLSPQVPSARGPRFARNAQEQQAG